MKFLLLFLLFSTVCHSKMYLKLEGETIMGHDYKSSAEYSIEIEDTKLVGPKGFYKYKYQNNKLVLMAKGEIDAHPIKVANLARKASIKADLDRYEEDCLSLKNETTLKPYLKRLMRRLCGRR